MKENSISYETAKQETERLITEIEELDKDRIENSSYSYEHHFIEKINEVIQVVNKHTEEMKELKER